MNDKLLEEFGLTTEQVEADARLVETENADYGITGNVYYGWHLAPDQELKTISVKLPVQVIQQLDTKAHQYHISRSELIRRELASL